MKKYIKINVHYSINNRAHAVLAGMGHLTTWLNTRSKLDQLTDASTISPFKDAILSRYFY